MCAVSVICDYGARLNDNFWTRETFPPFKRLFDEAERFDRETGQPHCEDPRKVALLERIERRLAAIEAELRRAKEEKP